MHFIIFTGGILEKGKAVNETLAKVTLSVTKAEKIIAADSGAETALKYHCEPEAVIGDLDSLNTETQKLLKNKGSKFITSPQEKNETDTELAVQYAIDHGATEISLLGGSEGNRLDHILANVFLGINFNIPLKLINGNSVAWLEKGPKTVTIHGQSGDLLSLIPLTNDVYDIETTNLYYPLKKQPLYFGKSRGISNVFTNEHVEVSFGEGILLFVHIKDDVGSERLEVGK